MLNTMQVFEKTASFTHLLVCVCKNSFCYILIPRYPFQPVVFCIINHFYPKVFLFIQLPFNSQLIKLNFVSFLPLDCEDFQ